MITTIQAGHYTIRGVSVGGVYTALMILPDWRDGDSWLSQAGKAGRVLGA